jgi:two-component system chemotaxis response regulator CheB
VVVDSARNGEEALEKIRTAQPDVVTLDINMPVMDGLDALARIMSEHPLPVVMVSSLTQEGALATFEAIELGAVDFVTKPSGTVSLDIHDMHGEIVRKVRAAARARLHGQRRRPISAPRRREPPASRFTPVPQKVSDRLIAIGVSTGGPRTLMEVLPQLPADLAAPIVIVQHMPPTFTASFAHHLDAECALRVKEAEQSEVLVPGQVYVAPGGFQLTVVPSALGPGAAVRLSARLDGQTFAPSVDVLFDSVAKLYGRRAIAVLLTGMGDDGANGMVNIRRAGGLTIAESEETAVIFGMPREAIARGGAEIVAPVQRVPLEIQAGLRRIK